jgi:hypothetical protein
VSNDMGPVTTRPGANDRAPSPAGSPGALPARRIVYTAIFGGYDTLQGIGQPSPGVRYICFTDDRTLRDGRWEIVHVDRDGDGTDLNRHIKINPHLYLPDHDYSLYVDGNVQILRDVGPLFEKYSALGIIAAPRHPLRTCLYDEARACIAAGKGDADRISEIVCGYEAAGFPRRSGLHEFHLLFRETYSPDVIRLMETWWREYERGGGRDQITFPYSAWRCAVPVNDLEESPRYSTRNFRLGYHNWEQRLPLHRRLLLYARINRHNSRLWQAVADTADGLVARRS